MILLSVEIEFLQKKSLEVKKRTMKGAMQERKWGKQRRKIWKKFSNNQADWLIMRIWGGCT